MLVPFSVLLSGATMFALVLNFPLIRIAVQSLFALGILTLIGLFLNFGFYEIFLNSLFVWLPAILLALVYVKSSSTTLTIQVLSLITIGALLIFYLLVENPESFWNQILINTKDILLESGLNDEAVIIQDQMNLISGQIASMIGVMIWSLYSFLVTLGVNISHSNDVNSKKNGSFINLNLGKSIASIAALSSLSLFVFDSLWIENLAYMSLLFFWLQGLSIIHWLRANDIISRFFLVFLYILFPILNIFIVMLLAVVGYTDAWFNFRSKIKVFNN